MSVERLGESVSIEVANDPPTPEHRNRGDRRATGAGHGLIGMRERVQLYGGTLTAAPRPDGGFVVRAVLPVVTDPALDLAR